MTATITEIEAVEIEELDFEKPCDNEGRGDGHCPNVAKWAIHWNGNHPCADLGVSCVCTRCKDLLMIPGASVRCSQCGWVGRPAKDYVRSIEPL